MKKSDKKKFLFIETNSPFGTSVAEESQIAMLATTALELDVSVIFKDDGVYQLCQAQEPNALEVKNFTLVYKALPLYGVSSVYVDKLSLEKRGLSSDDLLMSAELVEKDELSELIHAADIVLSY